MVTDSSSRATRMGEASNPDPGREVLGPVPAGPDSDLEPPLAEQVKGRQLLCQDHRMAEVVVQDERADTQACGRRGHGGKRGDGTECDPQVVGSDHGRVTDRFSS